MPKPNFFGTKYMLASIEGNFSNTLGKSSSDNSTHTEDAYHFSYKLLESIYAIECCNPSPDATDKMLGHFNLEDYGKFETIVTV